MHGAYLHKSFNIYEIVIDTLHYPVKSHQPAVPAEPGAAQVELLLKGRGLHWTRLCARPDKLAFHAVRERSCPGSYPSAGGARHDRNPAEMPLDELVLQLLYVSGVDVISRLTDKGRGSPYGICHWQAQTLGMAVCSCCCSTSLTRCGLGPEAARRQ